MIVFFVKMLSEVRKDKKILVHFIAPLLLIAPGLLTERGKKYRIIFYAHMILVSCCIFVLVYLQITYGKPPYMS